jgi:hypothetical protein
MRKLIGYEEAVAYPTASGELAARAAKTSASADRGLASSPRARAFAREYQRRTVAVPGRIDNIAPNAFGNERLNIGEAVGSRGENDDTALKGRQVLLCW